MKRIYLSHFLSYDTPFYGGEDRFLAHDVRSMEKGDSCNTNRWSFPNHAGTHVDMPRHFAIDGKIIDDYPPDFWIFKQVAIVVLGEVVPGSVIGPDMLEHSRIPASTEMILLKTGFGRFRNTPAYWKGNPVFHPELADFLRIRYSSLRAFGFDAISLSSWMDRPTGRLAHRSFLCGERPILPIEDMDLSQIDDSSTVSSITVAPLLVRGADASPCTIIAEVTDL